MAKLIILMLIIFSVSGFDEPITENYSKSSKRFRPNWRDLESRPLPEWYDKAKIGIFIHWGVYSVPSYSTQIEEWFWSLWQGGVQPRLADFMGKNYPPGFTYQDFAPLFTAEFFDPRGWAKLFTRAGAKYVVLTSKHHDGYTLFPSKRSFSWNSVDIGPKRDIVGELAEAVRAQNLKFGLYYSLYEWYNPLYNEDKKTGFITREYVNEKMLPEIKQIIKDYKPSVLWSDGDWEAYDVYWKSTELLAWLYNESPVKDEIVVNDRWGLGTRGKHGGFFNYDERFNPGTLKYRKWENALTLDRLSWGYRRNMNLHEVLSIEDLLKQIVSTVSCGGNVLMNVGPTKEGTIPLIFQERLLTLGSWLKINGEAIYGSSPWHYQNDRLKKSLWYTCKMERYNALNHTDVPAKDDKITAIYGILLKWPVNGCLRVRNVLRLLKSNNYVIEMLGNDEMKLQWVANPRYVEITLPNRAVVQSQHAWTLKFSLK